MTAFAVAFFWTLCGVVATAGVYCAAAVQRRERLGGRR